MFLIWPKFWYCHVTIQRGAIFKPVANTAPIRKMARREHCSSVDIVGSKMAAATALLDAAYTNVSLLADAAWAPSSMSPMGVPMTADSDDKSSKAFRRANQDLWLRCVTIDRCVAADNYNNSNNRQNFLNIENTCPNPPKINWKPNKLNN